MLAPPPQAMYMLAPCDTIPGKLPPPPEAVSVTDYTSTTATLAWAVPSSNCGDNSTCMYIAMMLDDLSNEMTRIVSLYKPSSS